MMCHITQYQLHLIFRSRFTTRNTEQRHVYFFDDFFLPWSFCLEYTLFSLKTSVNSTGSSGVSPITSVQLIMNLCYMCYISFSKRCVSYVSCAPFFQFWFSSLSVFDSVKFMTRKEKWILKANTLYLWHFICLLRSTGCWKQTLLHTKCSIPEVSTIGLR
jgi:hypothetical protein